ncbi:MAG: alanine--glyoxylate aminotransferase family protein [Candidatus Bathyarchaeota archaeon]|nr:alanine--glyoxylate aminotransferase family protein [Candidatus Bathyarchaeota archaeon]
MKERKLIMVPGPTNVPDRVTRAMLRPMISHRSPEFRALYESITENLRYLFQTKGDVYALTVSGTGGIECAVGNSVNPGDKVIIPVFGLFSERLKEAVIRRGGTPVEVPSRWGTAPTADQVRKAAEKEKDVKAIAVVYNETSTGVTVRDLPVIGETAQDDNLLFIVDAVSILGGDALPVDKWGVDICVTASQKCLACPPGLALFSVSGKAWETIERAEKPFYFDIVKMRDFSEKKETPFTPAVPLFFALDEALKMIREEGLEARFKRHKVCSEAFYGAVESMDLSPFPEMEVRSNTVIAFKKPDGIDGAKVREIMDERYGVVIAGGAGKLKKSIFRIGCMGTVSEAETLLTVNALESALAERGYPLNRGTAVEAARRRFHP